MTRRELETLRREIERIDAEILELIGQRGQVSLEIGLVKQRDDVPVRDRNRESAVKDAYVKRGRLHGVDGRLALRVAELLMADSIKTQKKPFRRDLTGKEVLVVGGSGRMGAWICRRLSNRGSRVSVWDPRGKLEGYESVHSLVPAARTADLIVISSPLGTSSKELRQVLKAGPKGLVFDVCSVKSHLASQLKAAARSGIDITSVHPMFGPNIATPRGRTVIVCDCGNSRAAARVQKLFEASGANVTRMPLERHDELMAYVLGLPHISSLLFASTLASSSESLDELSLAKGPSFERMLAASRDLARESVRVYHDIQALNPHTRKMFENYVNSVKLLKDASIRKDPDCFRRIMESDREYLEVR
jgi:prephenate dehydrogenase/chorismate mutase